MGRVTNSSLRVFFNSTSKVLLCTKLLLAQAIKLVAAAEVFNIIGLSQQRKAIGAFAGRETDRETEPPEPLVARITGSGVGSLTASTPAAHQSPLRD